MTQPMPTPTADLPTIDERQATYPPLMPRTDAGRATATQATIAALDTANRGWADRLTAMHRRMTALETELATVRQELVDVRQQATGRSTAIGSLGRVVTEALRQRQAGSEQLAQARADLADAHATIATLRQCATDAADHAEQMEHERDQARRERDDYARSRNHFADLLQAAASALHMPGGAPIDDLPAAASRLHAQLEEIRAGYDTARDGLSRYRDAITAERDQLAARLAALRQLYTDNADGPPISGDWLMGQLREMTANLPTTLGELTGQEGDR